MIIKDFLIAAAGAGGGAYGAQIIAEKSKSKDDLIKEIRNTNASLANTYTICNSLLSLKSQHLLRLVETHQAQKASVLNSMEQRRRGIMVPLYTFQADLQQLSLPYQPIEVLQNQLFEKLSIRGRALSLVTNLTQSIQTLAETCQKRNELIKLYQSKEMTQENLHIHYLGLPYNGGHINNEYPSTLDLMLMLTNDGAFFSHLLCKDLVKHGRRLRRRFKIRYGEGAPSVDKPDFSIAIASGLMPNANDYINWLTMFVTKPRPRRTFFARMRSKWYFWVKKGLA